MKKKVLVTGASGFVGKNLMEKLKTDFDTFGTYHSNKKASFYPLDITDSKSVDEVFEIVNPDIVIHSAALPNVNYCEVNKPLAKMINLDGTLNVVNACKRHKAKLLFISTDYVFDGEDGPYSEDDKTNPLNYYGELKLQAEREIKGALADYLIIRTTNIYGYDRESKNFVMFLLDNLETQKKIIVAKDQYGNPTYIEDLCNAIKELLLKEKNGFYNVAGPDNISRLEFAKIVAQVWGYDESFIVGKSTEDLKQDALRPKKSGFKIDKIQRELETEMHSTREGLRMMREISLPNP